MITMTYLPSTRAEVRLLGILYYQATTRCWRGHLSPRYTISAACIACARISSAKAEQRRKRRVAETEADQRKLLSKRMREILLKTKPYLFRRRERIERATPKWVDRAELKRIYDACPPGYEVDHIYPIAGKNASGLHVPWNLQYLPREENMRKFNHDPVKGLS
jgi:hypothetical protein